MACHLEKMPLALLLMTPPLLPQALVPVPLSALLLAMLPVTFVSSMLYVLG